MVAFPPTLERLVQLLSTLPGIGRKSATRTALRLVESPRAECEEFARVIVAAKTTTRPCSICGAYTEDERCGVCADARRDQSVICVVERASDVPALERTGRFRGLYHVLGGLLSPLDGVGPENLRLDALASRARTEGVREIILALNPTSEGEATALYVARLLSAAGVRVTRIASGLPVGGDLDLADDLTLGTALEERREL